ncbi:hypothetical protein AHF37_02807 [Paragonimus kellicotti]|nr:hypothetical protein AHF37_02807 [Paragonimus kellicotti]
MLDIAAEANPFLVCWTIALTLIPMQVDDQDSFTGHLAVSSKDKQKHELEETTSDLGQSQSFEPVLWSQYFNIRDDIELEAGTFRIYRRGVEGPLLFFIHGGGFSSLTWAVLSAIITEQVKCQCLAVDMRGHGDTKCDDDSDLSIDTLSKDVIKIIFAMYPTEAPPIILVGHSDLGQSQSFEPVLWSQYFNIRDDIELEAGTFRIYRRGVEGPLLFFIHGGGFSSLTWAVLSAIITEQVKCQCLAVDMRGHGDTKCDDDSDLSIDTLSKDVIKIIFAMYPTEAPPIILVGHSMGGAVAVHVAHKRTIPSLAGLVVIDVVEGSALNSLQGMTAFLKGRPQSFQSLSQAIEWSVRSSQLRNSNSARVSFPGQLKRIATGQTATWELERGTALIFSYPTFISNSPSASKPDPPQGMGSSHQVSDIITEVAEEETDAANPREPADGEDLPLYPINHCQQKPVQHDGAASASEGPTPGVPRTTSPTDSLSDSSLVSSGLYTSSTLHANLQSEYTWRIDLMKTQPFWHDWFYGLSQRFLSIPEPKLLLLAGVDRLDKDLTIGQMQGKFQLHVFPKCGHAVHEDVPDKVAELDRTVVIEYKVV